MNENPRPVRHCDPDGLASCVSPCTCGTPDPNPFKPGDRVRARRDQHGIGGPGPRKGETYVVAGITEPYTHPRLGVAAAGVRFVEFSHRKTTGECTQTAFRASGFELVGPAPVKLFTVRVTHPTQPPVTLKGVSEIEITRTGNLSFTQPHDTAQGGAVITSGEWDEWEVL